MHAPLLATADPQQALLDLDTHGAAILSRALPPAAVRDVRARLLMAAALSEADGVPTRGYPFDTDTHNQRVFHLFNLDPIFVELIRRPAALQFVAHLLGADFLISNFSANITAPGSQRMQLHADQGYVLPPWPAQALACNVAWLLDDFTPENGGTRYVPGSHRHGHSPDTTGDHASVAITAPAGSLLIMDGRVWHQTGNNQTQDVQRAALFGYYVRRWLRPQINWNAALWPSTVAELDPEFLHLLGFYSGNVEFQIPNGTRAPVHAPPSLTPHGASFALGPQNTEGER